MDKLSATFFNTYFHISGTHVFRSNVFSQSCGDLFVQMSLSGDLGSDFASRSSPWDFLHLRDID